MRYVPALLWAALLFFLSSLPSTKLPTLGVRYEDLVLHFGAYAVFGFLLAYAVASDKVKISRKQFVMIVLLGALYGVSDEFHQMYVPGRVPAVSDLVADAVGVVFGVWLYSRSNLALRGRKPSLH